MQFYGPSLARNGLYNCETSYKFLGISVHIEVLDMSWQLKEIPSGAVIPTISI